MKEESKQELRDTLASDPTDSSFVRLAELHLADQEYAQAREVCFYGLTSNPENLQARLLLSRLFYLDGMLEFSVRELVELKKRAELPAVDTLLDLFGPHAERFLATNLPKKALSADAPEEVEDDDAEEILAEIDLDDEFVSAFEELEKS